MHRIWLLLIFRFWQRKIQHRCRRFTATQQQLLTVISSGPLLLLFMKRIISDWPVCWRRSLITAVQQNQMAVCWTIMWNWLMSKKGKQGFPVLVSQKRMWYRNCRKIRSSCKKNWIRLLFLLFTLENRRMKKWKKHCSSLFLNRFVRL